MLRLLQKFNASRSWVPASHGNLASCVRNRDDDNYCSTLSTNSSSDSVAFNKMSPLVKHFQKQSIAQRRRYHFLQTKAKAIVRNIKVRAVFHFEALHRCPFRRIMTCCFKLLLNKIAAFYTSSCSNGITNPPIKLFPCIFIP